MSVHVELKCGLRYWISIDIYFIIKYHKLVKTLSKLQPNTEFSTTNLNANKYYIRPICLNET